MDPAALVEVVRRTCAGLPEVEEVAAWTGTSWRVRGKTFAHVLEVRDGWPAKYATVFGTDGPATVLTFQSEGEELEVLAEQGPPFFRPPWRPGIVGLLVEEETDPDEVAELVTDSWRILAPRALRERWQGHGGQAPPP